MLVTITEYRMLAQDENSNMLPVGDGLGFCQSRTSAGAFGQALNVGTALIRIATDTAVTLDIADGAAELFMPGVEYKFVNGGETVTVALA